MRKFIADIKARAKRKPGKIVFPEAAMDDRIILATKKILRQKLAKPILIGKEIEILKRAKKLGVKLDLKRVQLIDPEDSPLTTKYVKEFIKLRGGEEREAWKTVIKPNYFATMMVHMEDADGMVSGTFYTTAEKVRPALQIIKTKEKFHKVSGFFFMMLEKRLLLFADCAINIEPNSHDLAHIALDTAKTAEDFGIKPKVAMLSFSTNRSADHPFVDKVREAVALAKYEEPKLVIDGEMQVDAAIIPEICAKKFPSSKLKGNANVLIFPDLQSGNIAYKLMERLGGYTAIGPVLQGLKKPMNDVSRGCKVEDIVNITAITSLQTQK
ncbi:MAG: phosphate acetyltransferase, phosphate acetyltransferase [Candidatus Peregrinibacteria bacterium GW2011_GWF2_43_17]|nr:MAG: phosphate acetyltransferase, phosphate acetyltransferase [Candidatus Peregrinibacteria bacterium GW2011_GWF2_43_17]KKT20381.1 MAG: phosphotransacetylase [Candidatus Peregrinibacteria bacterium GW2011_GWA2_43_8]HAU40264.1 phosphate acetyltransferase [Candidatus Peregrinibacteria bacterium]